MSTRLAGLGLIGALLLGTPHWGAPNSVQAGTIKEIVDNDGGIFTVGALTFTFDATSVTGNRTSAEVLVAAFGNNGIEFTINPILRLDSMADGMAKNLSIDISYTVTSTSAIVSAILGADPFARFAANGAFSQVTETLSNGSTLFVGSGATNQANVPSVGFAGVLTLDVVNAGKLFTPARGPGENQDEAQLTTITNTFNFAPEPSTLVTWSLIAGVFGVGGLRRRVKRPAAAG